MMEKPCHVFISLKYEITELYVGRITYVYIYDICIDVHITILIEIRIITYYVSLSLDNALWQRI